MALLMATILRIRRGRLWIRVGHVMHILYCMALPRKVMEDFTISEAGAHRLLLGDGGRTLDGESLAVLRMLTDDNVLQAQIEGVNN